MDPLQIVILLVCVPVIGTVLYQGIKATKVANARKAKKRAKEIADQKAANEKNLAKRNAKKMQKAAERTKKRENKLEQGSKLIIPTKKEREEVAAKEVDNILTTTDSHKLLAPTNKKYSIGVAKAVNKELAKQNLERIDQAIAQGKNNKTKKLFVNPNASYFQQTPKEEKSNHRHR